jgi:hypothetical protein
MTNNKIQLTPEMLNNATQHKCNKCGGEIFEPVLDIEISTDDSNTKSIKPVFCCTSCGTVLDITEEQVTGPYKKYTCECGSSVFYMATRLLKISKILLALPNDAIVPMQAILCKSCHKEVK